MNGDRAAIDDARAAAAVAQPRQQVLRADVVDVELGPGRRRIDIRRQVKDHGNGWRRRAAHERPREIAFDQLNAGRPVRRERFALARLHGRLHETCNVAGRVLVEQMFHQAAADEACRSSDEAPQEATRWKM